MIFFRSTCFCHNIVKGKEIFTQIASGFVLELMSPTNTLKDTQGKITEYMENQVKLGWLINRKTQRLEICRQG